MMRKRSGKNTRCGKVWTNGRWVEWMLIQGKKKISSSLQSLLLLAPPSFENFVIPIIFGFFVARERTHRFYGSTHKEKTHKQRAKHLFKYTHRKTATINGAVWRFSGHSKFYCYYTLSITWNILYNLVCVCDLPHNIYIYFIRMNL